MLFRVDVGKATVVTGAFSIVNFDHSPLAWEWRSWDGSLKGVWVRYMGCGSGSRAYWSHGLSRAVGRFACSCSRQPRQGRCCRSAKADRPL